MNNEVLDLLSSEAGKEILKKMLAEKSILDFSKQAWDVIEPGVEFKDNWHLQYLEEELLLLVLDRVGHVVDIPEEKKQQLIEHELKRRVCLNVPPRTMKSLFLNVFFPCWLWIHVPEMKIITVSYSVDLSLDLNKKRRTLIQSDWYQANWGHIVKMTDEQNTKTFFENTRQGSMYATSIGGTLTGKGGDIILLDDIQNPAQAESEANRKQAIDFLKNTLPSRLNDFNKGIIINIQQRLHVSDVSGYIKENYDFYKFITLPVLSEKDILTYRGPITGKKWSLKPGEVLWPGRMGADWIEQTKKEQGMRTFNAQYLQDPSPENGQLLNRDWFKHWHKELYFNNNIKSERLELIQSWDMAFKGKAGNDYIACSVLLTDGVTTQLIDRFKGNRSFTQSLREVDIMFEKWNDMFADYGLKIPITILIEDKANGPAVIDTLKDAIPGILPITPLGDKFSRMASIGRFIEAGNVYLPETNTSAGLVKYAWLEDAIEELIKFPAVAHDDFADSFSQGLAYIYLNRKKKRTLEIY